MLSTTFDNYSNCDPHSVNIYINNKKVSEVEFCKYLAIISMGKNGKIISIQIPNLKK